MRSLLTAVSAAAVLWIGLQFVSSKVSNAQEEKQAAGFTIQYAIEYEWSSPAGARHEFWTAQMGRSSDGSMYEHQDGSASYAYDAKTRRIQEFDLGVGMVSTTTLSVAEASARATVFPSGTCLAPSRVHQFAGFETLLGVQVVKYSMRKSDGAQEGSVWLAPSYNCTFLKDEVIHYSNGQVVGRQVRRATLVIPGEPDRRLFSAPDGLKEVPPSEIEFARFRGRVPANTPIPECLRNSTRASDQQYVKQRRP